MSSLHLRTVMQASWLLLAASLWVGCGSSVFLHMRDEKVLPNVRVVLGGGGNSVAVLHGEGALLVDAKFADYARRLRSEVTAMGREVQRLVLTHWHLDHAGGRSLYPRAGAVLVHPKALERLRADSPGSTAWVEVEREVSLTLGKTTVRVMHLGQGHTDGDLVAYLPAEKILVAGDLFNTGYEPEADPHDGGNILALGATLDRMLALPFETVVPGHGEIATRAEVFATRQYLRTLEQEVRAARASGTSEDRTVATLSRHSAFKVIPFKADREKSVRYMFQALQEASAP